ncbi:MAG: GAF domain-containing sensor histidine kinase [Clostridia bacterium]|nr:GAF domain-containing sensor histidine kinase [Clostridia bacterium]
MNFRRLRWLFIIPTAIFIGAFEYLAHYPFHELVEETFPGWQENLFSVTLLMLGVAVFSNKIFTYTKELSEELLFKQKPHEEEMESIYRISQDISNLKDLESILAAVAEKACRFMSATCSRITILREDRDTLVVNFAGQDDLNLTDALAQLEDQVFQQLKLVVKSYRDDSRTVTNRLILVGVPIFAEDKLCGVFVLVKAGADGLDSHELKSLQSLSGQVAVAVENSRLLTEIEKGRWQAEELSEIGMELLSLLEVDKNLGSVLGKTRRLFGADFAAWSLYDEEKKEVYIKARHGSILQDQASQGDSLNDPRLKAGEGLSGRVVSSGHPVVLEDLDLADPWNQEEFPNLVNEQIKSAMAAPMHFRGQVFGALMIGFRRGHRFTEDEKVLLSALAHQAAVVIENLQLYEKVRDSAILGERFRLAREIHDGLSQGLGYLNIRTKYVIDLINNREPEKAVAEIADLRQVIKDLYQETRTAIANLKVALPQGTDLVDFVRRYLDEFGWQNNIEVRLNSPEAKLKFSPAVELQLVRIIQEALHNVRKHAKASLASVSFVKMPASWLIIIEDNGRGIKSGQEVKQDRVHGGHYGLEGMKERAEIIGGTLTVNSGPEGTRVAIEIPVMGGDNGGSYQSADS